MRNPRPRRRRGVEQATSGLSCTPRLRVDVLPSADFHHDDEQLAVADRVPSALVDWNNNYGDDPDKCVFFHCGNWAKAFLPDISIGTATILGSILGEQNTYGALAGRTPSGPVTFRRISTDDRNGRIAAYVGEGRFTDDPLKTFGTRAVVEVPHEVSLDQTL